MPRDGRKVFSDDINTLNQLRDIAAASRQFQVPWTSLRFLCGDALLTVAVDRAKAGRFGLNHKCRISRFGKRTRSRHRTEDSSHPAHGRVRSDSALRPRSCARADRAAVEVRRALTDRRCPRGRRTDTGNPRRWPTLRDGSNQRAWPRLGRLRR